MRIVVGCYDGSIHGWQSKEGEENKDKRGMSFELKFAYSSHQSCIKSIAMLPNLMVTGGTDEIIQVYDLLKNKEMGILEKHEGSVNSLAFVQNTHLLSGGQDGKLFIWRTKGWECIHELKGHKLGPVICIASHPTASIALTTSRDNNLRMWDLSVGKPGMNRSPVLVY